MCNSVKFKIKTYFWSGLIMGLFSIAMLAVMPSQVRLPMYDSGAPSPRIIPGICLVGILICSAVLLIQSLIFKKDKVMEFDWKKREAMCFYDLTAVYIYCPDNQGGIYPCSSHCISFDVILLR